MLRGVLVALLTLSACGEREGSGEASQTPASQRQPRTETGGDSGPSTGRFYRRDDLAAAVTELLATRPRVVAFGELHVRTDRAEVRSALTRFRAEVLPILAPQLSDLILETWIVDKRCGDAAATASSRVEAAMRRPPSTQNELGLVIQASSATKVRPHVLALACQDYERVAPAGGAVDVEALLGLVTSELRRVTVSALAHRDREAGARPIIAVYGGAMHNDLYPYRSVAQWSFAGAIDAATGGRLLEIDLYVPELALADPLTRGEPWWQAVADQIGVTGVIVVERGPRSFAIVLPWALP